MKKAIIIFPKQHHPNKACWKHPFIPVEFIEYADYIETRYNSGFGPAYYQLKSTGALVKLTDGTTQVIQLEMIKFVDEWPTEEILEPYVA